MIVCNCNKSDRKKSSSTDKLSEDAVDKAKYVDDEKQSGRKNKSETVEDDILDVPACPDIGPVV